MEDCSICFEPYTKLRAKINCFKCDFAGCRKCIQRYVIENASDVACMNCKTLWDRDFMNKHFTKTFITKDYKESREQILLDREKSLLPASQEEAENIRRSRTEREKLERLIEERKTLLKQIRQIERGISDEQTRLHQLSQGIDPEKSTTEKRTFTRKCPSDTCRGFLSSRWKCGLCELWVCPDCHEIKGHSEDSPHNCNPDTVATVRLLKDDSKPCPNCTALIYKIEGCNHMFCTECKTAFDWRTGAIHKNGNSNPHYYAWRRGHGGSNDDPNAPIPERGCGELTQYERERRILSHIFRKLNVEHTNPKYMAIEHILRQLRHIQTYDEPRFPIENVIDGNRDLRIKFLLKEITEYDWKLELQRREKDRAKRNDIGHIVRLLTQAAMDILNRIPQTRSVADVDVLIVELENLRTYVNQQLKLSSDKYGSKRIYMFTPTWDMIQDNWITTMTNDRKRRYGLITS